MSIIETKQCLYSGENFIPKRCNQVFATNKNRIAFHNNRANELRGALKVGNNQIMKNYKICNELLGESKTCIRHIENLRGRGFDPKFHTNLLQRGKSKSIAYVLHDVSFELIADDKCLITRL